MKFRKVAILGTGLLGASFAFAAKNRGLCEKISAWSRSESTRKKCSILPEIFDEVFDSPEKAVSDADLVVICTPTENIPGIAAQIAPNCAPSRLLLAGRILWAPTPWRAPKK